MISNEILIEYLYYIFGVVWEYDGMIANNKILFFQYDENLIGYFKDDNAWSGLINNDIRHLYDNIKNKDMLVWLRKRKLDKLNDK
jgi:hypothetical protein